MNVEPESQCHDATDACKVTSFSVSSQLSGTLKFSAKTGRQISAFPIIIDFRRLIQLASKSSVHNNIIPGTTNEELLHAVVGLYDVCLSEMTPDVLYSTVCDKWAKTILLIQDLKETVSELKGRKETELEANQASVDGSNTEGSCEESERDKATTEDDVFVPEDSPVSLFADIYSDTESESEEDSEDEDFSKGIHSFIKAAAERKKQRRKCVSVESRHVGIEDRLVGCLTYEKKYIKGTEKVAHLTLLSVRRRYRKFGVGKFLIKQVLEESVVGPYDAVVVHADNGAVDFFHRCGFSDDVVLNSRWSELAEQFTNCTLMCFLPGFTVPPAPVDGEKESSCLVALEKEMKQWKEKSLEAYQAQLTCYMRMKQEVVQLQHLVHSQSSLLRDLSVQNQHLLRDKKISDHKVKVFGEADLPSTEDAPVFTEDDPETAGVLLELEKRVEMLDLMRRYRHSYHSQSSEPGHHMSDGAYVRSQEEPYDHTLDAAMFYKITEEFKHSVGSDQSLTQKYEVNMITKACLSRKAELDLWVCLAGLVEPNNCIQMYYCQQGQTTGTETNPPGERTDRLQAILNEGFSEQEFVCGSGGKGLYFTRYPSRASQFSSHAGVLILAEVALGKSEVLDTPNPQRDSPGYGYDSILVRGESSGEGPEDMLEEKFVVFNPSQARPVSMISYSAVKDKV